MKSDFHQPPPHLRPDTAAWWQSITADFALEPHHIRLLRLACEAWDSGQQARETLAQQGTTYVDRFGQPRARPEVAMERDARFAFARLMRDLALDVDGPAAEGARPPHIAGNARLRTTG